ncbi:MAG TPA: RNA degradosome polyphosphate kinase [Streptosporangiaceae bacterium]|nr:RNA degradosome polyphosphate kinase [Streptosporangiaceae bacterium]
MDSGQATPPGGGSKKAQKPAGRATRSTSHGNQPRSEPGGVAPGVPGQNPGRTRPAASFDAAERDSVERAAAVIAGVGQDSGPALAVPGLAADLPPDRYLDREESWLRFSQRVLELAEDPNIPVLERIRFESIFASALDEFFMVRVAGRIRRMATGLPVESVSGKAPDQILENTLIMARGLAERHALCFTERLLPALAASGIEILRWKELLPQEQAKLQRLFKERIYPVLTPLAVDPAHPFPFISGLSLSLAVMVADPRSGLTLFARVKVPPLLPRFLTVSPSRFVPLEDVIAAHLTDLFAGLEVIEHHAFRVTRIRDLEIDEDVTENLLQSLERELMRRRFEPAVRLEVEESISSDVLDKLVTELDVDHRAVYRLPGPLDLTGLSAIADLDLRNLKYPAFVPAEGALPQDRSVFATLSERDVLVHLPYDSFTASVQRLVVSAAADPRVLAIKHTLYRTSGDSEIVDALIDAAEAGKQVVVVVEIKARGDEEANIAWAHKLEEAGCHVVYGFVGLKTHCKMVLVVREEADGSLRRFCHIGTGNYHPKTARLYEDYGLLTADRQVGEDITDLFNHLTGYSRRTEYRRLLVAPAGLRSGLIRQIEEQAQLARDGKPARIRMKCNAIIDEAIIDALYRASIAGVPIDLWVRGICSLRPGVPGLSETISVRSVVGRFLEHSRIYAFGSGQVDARDDVWIGSADLMHRNLDRRVELLIRVTDPAHQRELRSLIDLAMDPGVASWWLGQDGIWTRHHLDSAGAPLIDLQDHLIRFRQSRTPDTEVVGAKGHLDARSPARHA